MDDAFQAARAMADASRGQTNALVLNLPDLPVWVPTKARQQLFRMVRQTIHFVLTDLAGRISQRAPVGASGHLAQSFSAYPARATGGIEIVGASFDTGLYGRVFSSLPYAIVIDQGRLPGRPISRAGIDAIGLWAQRKLGLSKKEANRAKWAIAHHIIAYGIESRDFVQAAFSSGEMRWQSMFDSLAGNIADALTKV